MYKRQIQDAYVYNPIVELTTDDVWDVLLKVDGGKTPWGSNNNELVSLYADADSGECPFAGIHAGGQTPVSYTHLDVYKIQMLNKKCLIF